MGPNSIHHSLTRDDLSTYSLSALTKSYQVKKYSTGLDSIVATMSLCAITGGATASSFVGGPLAIAGGLATGLAVGSGLAYGIWKKHSSTRDLTVWNDDGEIKKRAIGSNTAETGSYSDPIEYQGQKVRIHYFEKGNPLKPLIFFIHGFGSNAYQFSQIFDELAKHYHVVSVDLPGCGYSDPLPHDSYEFATDIKQVMTAFIEQKNWQNITIVMNSLGGPIGEQFADNNQRIAQMIFFDGMESRGNLTPMALVVGATGLLQKGMAWFADTTGINPVSQFAEEIAVLGTIGFWAHPTLETISWHDIEEFSRPIVSYKESDPERSIRLMAARGEYAWNETKMLASSEQLETYLNIQRNLKQRALVVQSEWDRFVPVVLGKRLEETLPNAEMLLIPHDQVPDAGHTLMSDNPAMAISIIDDFMQHRIPGDDGDEGDKSYLRYNPWQPSKIYQRVS